jgi:lipopolysaccharide transport system permease protein
VIVSLVDFLISFVLMAGLMAWYHYWPSPKALVLLALVPATVAAATGPGLWIAALNVRYRDFRYIVPFIVQLGVYVSPVGFSSSVVPAKWRLLYSLNPLVGLIDAFRWAIIANGERPSGQSLLASGGMIVFMLVSGVWYFRKTERTFADVI